MCALIEQKSPFLSRSEGFKFCHFLNIHFILESQTRITRHKRNECLINSGRCDKFFSFFQLYSFVSYFFGDEYEYLYMLCSKRY